MTRGRETNTLHVVAEDMAVRLDRRHATHQAQDEQGAETIRAAETTAAQARAEVVAESLLWAVEDGDTYLAARAHEQTASHRIDSPRQAGSDAAKHGTCTWPRPSAPGRRVSPATPARKPPPPAKKPKNYAHSHPNELPN